jgi:hypothetical protein
MTDWQHRDAAAGRWHAMTLAEQLGNVGSEISRAIRWRDRNSAQSQAALFRALDLLDLSLDDPRHRRSLPRLRELARVREVVVDHLAGQNEYGTTSASLQRYFDQFAVSARRRDAAK